MILSDFLIRKSGVKANSFYVDLKGAFEVTRLHGMTGIPEKQLTKIFEEHGGVYDTQFDVFYFDSRDKAESVCSAILHKVKPSYNTRVIELTENEIEYIRRALINEDSNIIFTNSKIRDSIFDKLNH